MQNKYRRDWFRLTNLYRRHARKLNPNGWLYIQDTPAPATLDELKQTAANADAFNEPMPITFNDRFNLKRVGVDMIAFYAAHERTHIKHNLGFTLEEEKKVIQYQTEWLKDKNNRAACLHATMMAFQFNWWESGGDDFPDNSVSTIWKLPQALDEQGLLWDMASIPMNEAIKRVRDTLECM